MLNVPANFESLQLHSDSERLYTQFKPHTTTQATTLHRDTWQLAQGQHRPTNAVLEAYTCPVLPIRSCGVVHREVHGRQSVEKITLLVRTHLSKAT